MTARPHFQKLVEKSRLLSPLAAGIVFPCDRDALQMALSGAFAGYLAPTLIGPESRIRDLAGKSGLDISRLTVIDTPDDPQVAGARAADLARDGKIAALVKGSLSNEDLLGPVVDGRIRLAHRAPTFARVFPRHPRSTARLPARRRADERHAQSRGQARHRAEHDSACGGARDRRTERRHARRDGWTGARVSARPPMPSR